MNFVGEPGGHEATISYLGFEPIRLKIELKPIGKDGGVIGNAEQRVQLPQFRK
jgi:hypothetical protein